MVTLSDEKRRILASELKISIQFAQNHIIAYSIINKIKKWTRIGESIFADLSTIFLNTASVLLVTWLINRITRIPITGLEALILLAPAFLTGLNLFIIKVVSERILLQNLELLSDIPADEECYKNFSRDFRNLFKPKWQIIFALLFSVLGVATAISLSSRYTILTMNFGFYVGMIFASITIGFGAYFDFVFPKVFRTLANNHLVFYSYNPAQSRVVKGGMRIINQVTLGTGIIAMAIMIILFIINPWNNQLTFIIALSWLIFSWGLTSYTYLIPSKHISSAILREKQFQLDRLDNIIQKFDLRLGSLNENEMDRLTHLIDLREGISRSNSTALDLFSLSKYFTSLILPTISFVIGAWTKLASLIIPAN